MPATLLLGWPMYLLPNWENVSKSFSGKKPLVAEHAVQRLHRMAFAQDEMVAVHGGEVLRSHVHHPVVQHVQDVAHAEIPADMSRFGPVDHVQHPQAQGV